MQHEVILRFCIWGFEDILPENITQLLDINPSKIYVKGKQMNSINPRIAKGNGWIIDSSLDKYAPFEDQMEALSDILEPKIDLLKPLCEKYYCEFSCAIFMRYDNGESLPSIHLGSRYNKLTKELNIEFDIDLYNLPNES